MVPWCSAPIIGTAGCTPGGVETIGALEDRLAYLELPTWFHPMRHSLGKALLAEGKSCKAEDARAMAGTG